MDRHALGRDARLSRRMAWTMLALALVYGGALAYVTLFAVPWARSGVALALVLSAFIRSASRSPC